MQQPKYKQFELTLINGSTVVCSAPTCKVTINYAANVAYHWAKVNKKDVISIKPIK